MCSQLLPRGEVSIAFVTFLRTRGHQPHPPRLSSLTSRGRKSNSLAWPMGESEAFHLCTLSLPRPSETALRRGRAKGGRGGARGRRGPDPGRARVVPVHGAFLHTLLPRGKKTT